MTCIVGYRDNSNNSVLIGGDSAAVTGINTRIIKHPKVFRNGDFVFGCTTSFRMMQLIQFKFTPPTFNNSRVGFGASIENSVENKGDLFKYMCTIFVDELRKCLDVGGFLTVENKRECGGEFIVGYKGALFQIFSDFTVLEYKDGFCAAGCGEQYAVSTLKTLENFCPDLTSDEKVKAALENAAYFSGGVCGPFEIICST
jgi:ATP-dependent protease HslVU (ClpYQ) peptidase subunit